jgi:hypothetical protein
LKTIKKASIAINLELFDYTRDDMDKYYYRDKDMEEEEESVKKTLNDESQSISASMIKDSIMNSMRKHQKSEISMDMENNLKKRANNKTIESVFIPCQNKYTSKDKFQNGNVQIFIDQVRFLPSNVTNIKMVVRFVDKNFCGSCLIHRSSVWNYLFSFAEFLFSFACV